MQVTGGPRAFRYLDPLPLAIDSLVPRGVGPPGGLPPGSRAQPRREDSRGTGPKTGRFQVGVQQPALRLRAAIRTGVTTPGMRSRDVRGRSHV
jgi:hypothetical protein